MAENVFEAVKQSVSTREAAEFYGIEVKRNGMACCPFHDDKNPSMKVDQRFHCFGCGEDGDVIDFTAKLFNLSPKEAAEKLDLLAKKHPDQITRKDAHNFTVPKRCVSVREPYSAERRKAASERAKAAGYQPPMRKSDS